EEEERLLREELPGYAEDWQLREALAKCEIAFLSEEQSLAASTCSESRSAAAAAAAAPLRGLKHFSGDGVDGVFMGAAGVPVRYRLFPKYLPASEGGALRPGVVLLTGLMETMAKYGETIAYLNDRGFSVYTYDHHAQGLSGRLPVPDGADPTVAHITNFQDYADDLLHFSRVILPATVPRGGDGGDEGRGGGGRKGGGGGGGGEKAAVGGRLEISVVAHSMGGLTAVLAALEDPPLFKGVVLAAPMMAPNTAQLPNMVVGAAAWVATKLRQGHRSPIRRPAGASMEWSKVTHDKSRLRLWETLRGGVGCVLQRGPSFSWLSQAVGASKRVRRRLSQLSVPILVLEAGLDVMVRSDGIQRLRRKVPSAEYRLFDSAYHDLFDEADDIR
ncbi:unnamed protein product, partial [Laminaria digitata]